MPSSESPQQEARQLQDARVYTALYFHCAGVQEIMFTQRPTQTRDPTTGRDKSNRGSWVLG
jgi:hypothetical protein